MHEMSLAENVLQIIEDARRDQGFSRVKTVVLEIGRLAAVETEALRFCFDAVTQGSMAEGRCLRLSMFPLKDCAFIVQPRCKLVRNMPPAPTAAAIGCR